MKKPTTYHTPPVTKLPTIKIWKPVDEIEALTIFDEASMTTAVMVLSKLNTELDRITLDKEKLTKPMNEALKEIRSRYKPFEAKLEDAIAYVRKQMSIYQTEQVETTRMVHEKLAEKAGTDLSLEEASTQIAAITGPEQRVVTNQGSVSFREWPMCEVEDITKVPAAYLEADLSAIKKLLPKKVEGIRYWTEQRPINRKS